ncbi:MBL fold metallo-hydrolase [Xenorhabdus bovienii]|uniref:Putative exported protein n=2 Tax=Xenorhabdus bovienii TaxID=40576 RepID=A0A077PUL3_XENBV|nr:MBL fold metallo-hydrolase [Xenorhabdus bovienii]MCG3470731.1 MBL fold metallo-hydrolase [Xenorhabdus bovienii]CDG88824.1 Putative exported protein [Xenorhabdus bovienii str. feltiae France]CDG93413.1 Putative exported protein [Xenorhabdus bovienii str. feltiae Florida]CDH03020.1 Putative exported protein [Xenorhabdus bovienii str. feltiae Moldova]CDH24377.1 Putative exported protein [Xenorhabdus bovienii str. kraussei Becker Underwood]
MARKTTLNIALAATLSLGIASLAQAANLKLDIYNPGETGIFPVSSEIISGDHEVVLIDAQFKKSDAQALVKMIQQTGKKLTTIYISQSDPDFYFGLDVITTAFPEAKVIASPETIKAINETKDGKLAYWGGILQDQAPKKVIVPEPLKGNTFTVDGEKLIVEGLDGPAADRTFVWVPKLKAVVGGVTVSDNIHVWIADTQTKASRQHWMQTLDRIKNLKPETVVPGHYLGNSSLKLESVTFTQNYLTTLEKELPKAKDAESLIAAMKKHYPGLADESSLELSAKVLKGEMKWPQ